MKDRVKKRAVKTPIEVIVKKPMKVPDSASWSFKSKEIADNFDAHVNEQLPWYKMATDMVVHFGTHYLTQGGRMYDFGASTGNITRSLHDIITKRNVEAISFDNSQEMVDVFQGAGEIHCADVRDVKLEPYDFATSFLMLLFLSPEDQDAVLAKMVKAIKPGGCLFIVDRTVGKEGYLGTVLHRFTLANKLAAGATYEDVMKKELSLMGVQRPIEYNRLLARYNAQEVFRMADFAGWVITN